MPNKLMLLNTTICIKNCNIIIPLQSLSSNDFFSIKYLCVFEFNDRNILMNLMENGFL